MDNRNVAPVNHGILSSTGTIAGGAVGGAITNGASWYAGTVATLAVLGGVASAVVFPGLVVPFLIGGIVSGIAAGFTAGPFVGAIATAFGGIGGALQGNERVKAEQGAANELQAQKEIYQAQVIAQNNAKTYNFPPQGSAMNPAGTTISAMQPQGLVAGQQLQLA